jgi:hypothetical protein
LEIRICQLRVLPCAPSKLGLRWRGYCHQICLPKVTLQYELVVPSWAAASAGAFCGPECRQSVAATRRCRRPKAVGRWHCVEVSLPEPLRAHCPASCVI